MSAPQEKPAEPEKKMANRKLQRQLREQQKAQARMQAQNNQQNSNDSAQQNQNSRQQGQNKSQNKGKSNESNENKNKQQEPENQSEIGSLFSHILVVHKWTSKELLDKLKPSDRPLIHPALLEYALQTAQDISLDEDERTKKFLRMMKQQINDEPISPNDDFYYAVYLLIKRTMNLLSNIRLTPIGVGNVVRYIKNIVTSHQDHKFASPEEFRTHLKNTIDHYISDKIDDVAQFLAKTTAKSILDGDVILTYGYSPVICKALKLAANNKVKFKVIVVDSRPNFNSRTLIEQIPDLDVRYVLISGLSYVMPEVKKVLIEPNGILSNNAAQTPIGTAMISMVAHECGVPVIFVCGSYRFVSDVRIDALSKNERISEELIKTPPRDNIKTDPEYLSLIYDVTPGQYVDVVICELGNIPVNSISTNIKFIQEAYTMFTRPQTKSVNSKGK